MNIWFNQTNFGCLKCIFWLNLPKIPICLKQPKNLVESTKYFVKSTKSFFDCNF